MWTQWHLTACKWPRWASFVLSCFSEGLVFQATTSFFHSFCFPSRKLSDLLMLNTAEEQINLSFLGHIKHCGTVGLQHFYWCFSISIFSLFWRGQCTAAGLHYKSYSQFLLVLLKKGQQSAIKSNSIENQIILWFHAKAMHNYQNNNNKIEEINKTQMSKKVKAIKPLSIKKLNKLKKKF